MQKQTKRIAILIDGGNFYFKLKDSGGDQTRFDFGRFSKFLSGRNKVN